MDDFFVAQMDDVFAELLCFDTSPARGDRRFDDPPFCEGRLALALRLAPLGYLNDTEAVAVGIFQHDEVVIRMVFLRVPGRPDPDQGTGWGHAPRDREGPPSRSPPAPWARSLALLARTPASFRTRSNGRRSNRSSSSPPPPRSQRKGGYQGQKAAASPVLSA